MKIKNLVRAACLSTVAAFGLAATSANAATLELGLAIDGSGSMSVAEFNLQRDAYISVLSDITVLPRDGTTAIGIKVLPMRFRKATKQLATLGPASSSFEMIEKLFLSGN